MTITARIGTQFPVTSPRGEDREVQQGDTIVVTFPVTSPRGEDHSAIVYAPQGLEFPVTSPRGEDRQETNISAGTYRFPVTSPRGEDHLTQPTWEKMWRGFQSPPREGSIGRRQI